MHPVGASPSPWLGHQVPRSKEYYALKDRNRDIVDRTVPQTCLGAWDAWHQPCGDGENLDGTHHPDGLHISVDESEETLPAQGHLLLLVLTYIRFLGVLSTSWLQF